MRTLLEHLDATVEAIAAATGREITDDLRAMLRIAVLIGAREAAYMVDELASVEMPDLDDRRRQTEAERERYEALSLAAKMIRKEIADAHQETGLPPLPGMAFGRP